MLPKHLRSIRRTFWIFAIFGVVRLVAGFDTMGSGAGIVRFMGWNVVGTIAFVVMAILIGKRDPSTPQRLVGWFFGLLIVLVFTEIIYCLATASVENWFGPRLQVLAMLLVIYFFCATQLRYLQSTQDYYGAVARSSRFGWLNRHGKRMLIMAGKQVVQGLPLIR